MDGPLLSCLKNVSLAGIKSLASSAGDFSEPITVGSESPKVNSYAPGGSLVGTSMLPILPVSTTDVSINPHITTALGSISGNSGDVPAPAPSYASLLKSTEELKELGTPTENISGAPFVLIPEENIQAAKKEFKDYIFAKFHSDVPPMGRIIGILNAVWANYGPRIYAHNLGQGSF